MKLVNCFLPKLRIILILFFSLWFFIYFNLWSENDALAEDSELHFLATSRNSCFIEKWNRKNTDSIPHHWSHTYFMMLELSKQDNLTPDFTILSAFVYNDHISVVITSQKLFKSTLYCRYFDCHNLEIPFSSWKSVVFPESVIYCPRRVGAVYVSVTKFEDDESPSSVKLINRIYEKPINELAICVAPLYGDEPKWLQIIEFIEHHKLQEVSYFYFYLLSMSSYDRQTLDSYSRDGILDVVSMLDKYQRPVHLYQIIQVQDCHQRSKHHSKWVAFIDIDERIVTYKKSITYYLSIIQNDKSVSDIDMMVQRILKTDDVPKKYKNQEQIENEMISIKYTNTTDPTWKASKAIIRPEKIAVMSIHYVVARYPGFKNMKMSKNQIILKHYRNTKFRNFGKQWEENYEHFETTQPEHNFLMLLKTAVLKKTKSIYEKIPVKCETISEDSWKSRQMPNPCKSLPFSI